MAAGYVGILTADLHLPESRSLKEKRKELLRVKSGLARRFACSVAEVDHHELWQRSRISVALVTREGGEADAQIDAADRWLNGDPAFVVVGSATCIVALSEELESLGDV